MDMIILPSLDAIIISKMSPEEICEAMRVVTVPRREHHYGDRRGEFIGEVSTAGFRIISNLCYKDSFLPIITGSIRTKGKLSIITIKMRMHLLVSMFMIVWFGPVIFFMLQSLLLMIDDKSYFMLLLGTGVMMLLGQSVMRTGFYRPAKKALKRMKELFGDLRSDGF